MPRRTLKNVIYIYLLGRDIYGKINNRMKDNHTSTLILRMIRSSKWCPCSYLQYWVLRRGFLVKFWRTWGPCMLPYVGIFYCIERLFQYCGCSTVFVFDTPELIFVPWSSHRLPKDLSSLRLCSTAWPKAESEYWFLVHLKFLGNLCLESLARKYLWPGVWATGWFEWLSIWQSSLACKKIGWASFDAL